MNSNANVVGKKKVSSITDIADIKKRAKLYKNFTILRIFVKDFEHINIHRARERLLAELRELQKKFKNVDISDLWNEFDRAFVAEMNVEINKFYDKSPVLDGFFAIDDHDTQYRVGKNILKIVISENEHKILSEVIPVNTNTNRKMVGI
jgi:hypothetical protein